MCLIVFAYQVHPDYPLIVAANRDEFHRRATKAAHWWPNNSGILAGKDLEADGTWLGVSRCGRFSGITNVREPQRQRAGRISRGLLPRRYLESKLPIDQFSDYLQESKDDYQGYNLLYGSIEQLFYFSNRSDHPEQLEPGIYGLSNAQLNTPWPKVKLCKKSLATLASTQQPSIDKLLELLSPTDMFADEQLPTTGVSLDWERKLSAICITGADYGTRSSTAVLFHRQGAIEFHEKTRVPTGREDVHFNFKVRK